MSTVDGPRLLRPGEFDELMALLDRYFHYERDGMAARLPVVYDRDRPERHAVIAVDGEIASHVACVPETLSVGEDATIECRGIGGVATAKPHRGNGYMSRLLEFWLERMADEGVSLSELGGNRERYGRFGWERAGREVVYTVTERSAPDRSADGTVTVYDGDDGDLSLLRSIHGDEPYRVVRDRETARAVYGQRGLETLVYRDGETTAYVALSRESRNRSIREFGGDAAGLEALVAALFERYDLAELDAFVPPRHPHNECFGRLSSRWKTRPPRSLNVRSLPALCSSFADQLERRWERRPLALEGSLSLGIAGDEGCVRLTYDPDSFAVEPASCEPDLSLSRRTATRLLFGGAGRAATLRNAHPILEAVTPLEYYVWHSERV